MQAPERLVNIRRDEGVLRRLAAVPQELRAHPLELVLRPNPGLPHYWTGGRGRDLGPIAIAVLNQDFLPVPGLSVVARVAVRACHLHFEGAPEPTGGWGPAVTAVIPLALDQLDVHRSVPHPDGRLVPEREQPQQEEQKDRQNEDCKREGNHPRYRRCRSPWSLAGVLCHSWPR